MEFFRNNNRLRWNAYVLLRGYFQVFISHWQIVLFACGLLFGLTFHLGTTGNVLQKSKEITEETEKVPNYALEGWGATVQESSATFTKYYLNKDWYEGEGAARALITKDTISPGQCWAMDATHGWITIKLALPINVTSVSISHINKRIAVGSHMTSALRDFQILGKEKHDGLIVYLGSFTYDISGKPKQLFSVKHDGCCSEKRIFSFITLKVMNNYGNTEFTCLYRVGVYGEEQKLV